MKLRFSRPTTIFIATVIGLVEATINAYPDLIWYAPLRYFVVGLLPIVANFLYQEEGVVPVSGQSGT